MVPKKNRMSPTKDKIGDLDSTESSFIGVFNLNVNDVCELVDIGFTVLGMVKNPK